MAELTSNHDMAISPASIDSIVTEVVEEIAQSTTLSELHDSTSVGFFQCHGQFLTHFRWFAASSGGQNHSPFSSLFWGWLSPSEAHAR